MRSGSLDENKHLVTMVRRQPPACVDTTSAGVAPPHPAPRAASRRGPRPARLALAPTLGRGRGAQHDVMDAQYEYDNFKDGALPPPPRPPAPRHARACSAGPA